MNILKPNIKHHDLPHLPVIQTPFSYLSPKKPQQPLNRQDEILSQLICDYHSRLSYLKQLLYTTNQHASTIQKILNPLFPSFDGLSQNCAKSLASLNAMQLALINRTLKTPAKEESNAYSAAFVIWGQSYKSKQKLVTKILGRSVLPSNISDRPLRISAGQPHKEYENDGFYLYDRLSPTSMQIPNSPPKRKRPDSLSFPERISRRSHKSSLMSSSDDSDDFKDMIENFEPESNEVSDFNLTRNLTSSMDKISVDIGFNHPVLQAGWQIIISPTDCGDKYSAHQILKFCTDNVSPFVLFALEKDCLTEVEIEEMQIVRNTMPNTAICFVSVNESDDANIHSQVSYLLEWKLGI